MYKRFRTLIIIALIAIGVAVLIRFRLNARAVNGGATVVQEMTTVDQGDILLTVSATGPIKARQNVSLAFLVTGKVTSINANEGDSVRQGQTIAMLDSQAYLDAIALAQQKVAAQQIALEKLTTKPRPEDLDVYQASLNVAKAKLKSAKSGPSKIQQQIDQLNIEKAKNQLWQTELDRDNVNKQKADLEKNPRTAPQAASLPSDNKTNAGIAASDFQVQIAQANLAADQAKSGDPASIAAAEAQITSAQVALDNLLKGGNQDDVARTQAQLQAAQAALELAKANLAKATLLAPFDGILAKVNLHVGETPPAGPAAVVLDASAFYVDVPVDEADVSRIAVGQPVTLTLDALPGVTVNGKVSRIADTSIKSGDVVTYTIHIDIDPAGHPLLSAMSATATITTDQIKNVVRVRNRFVRLDRTTNQAFANVRQPDGTFKEVEITLGLRNDTYSEVKSGLAAGDVIAVLQNSSTLLAPGTGNQGGGFGGPAR